MIITDDFVLINFPKTGSTFARNIIKTIYEKYPNKYFYEYFAPFIVDIKLFGLNSQHGTVQQIPDDHKSKKIISITRNPFSRYVSLYTFGWWKDHPQTEPDILKRDFTNYPDISFFEYLQMSEKYAKKNCLLASGINYEIDIGIHSIQFVQYYSYDPASAFKIIHQNGLRKKDLKVLFPKIQFLHQENLNSEIFSFLQDLGFNEEDLQFIKTLAPMNVSRNSNKTDYWKFYDDRLISYINEKDKLIFEIFPEYATNGKVPFV